MVANGRDELLSSPESVGKLLAYWMRRNDVAKLPQIEHDLTKIDLVDGYRRMLADRGEEVIVFAMADMMNKAIDVKKSRVQEIGDLVRGGKLATDRVRVLLHEADTILDDIKVMADGIQDIERGLG